MLPFRRLIILLITVLSLLSILRLAQGARAQSNPGDSITEESYWEMVADTRQLVERLKNSPTDTASTVLQQTANQWETFDQVRLDDGAVIQVESSFIAQALREAEPDLERLEKLLDELEDAPESWPRFIFTEADLQPLAGILAQPEFQWQTSRPSWLDAWWERLRLWLFNLLERLFGGRELAVEVPMADTLFVILGILGVALIFAFVLRNMLRSMAAEVAIPSAGLADEELMTSEKAYETARTFSSQEDYRLAVRYLYLSALLHLEERGLLRYDRTRTNREFLRLLHNQQDLFANLRAVVEVFDQVWYGFQPMDKDAYDKYQQQITSLRRLP
jgi:hypothetical protein